jgi:hypothetical protein
MTASLVVMSLPFNSLFKQKALETLLKATQRLFPEL